MSEQRSDRGGAQAPDPTAVRGFVLLFLAVLAGFVLLGKGIDSEKSVVDTDRSDNEKVDQGEDSGTTRETVTLGTDDTSDTTIVAPEKRPPAEVSVLVANASGISGAAGRAGNQLRSLGYSTPEESNASAAEVTTLYFVEGFDAEALDVATIFAVDPANVKPMPDPVPTIERIGEAEVLLLLGPDKATTA